MPHPTQKNCPYAILVITSKDKMYCAIVDKSSWRLVKKYNWYIHISKGRGRNAGQPYARASVKGKKLYLHRFLTNCPPDLHVDHKNHQTLDCRMVNLEMVTAQENMKRRRNCQKKKVAKNESA